MRKKSAGFYSNLLIFLCWLAYTASYFGRLNYGASMLAVINELSVSKTEAGLVSSFFFFAYGAGQLINGLLCHRYNAKIAVFSALAASAVLNCVMGVLSGIAAMKYLWGLNGLVQSVLWSSILRLQSEYLPQGKTPAAIVVMSTTTAVGTFFAYGFSALLVSRNAWRVIFFLASGVIVAAALLWIFGLTAVQKNMSKIESEATIESPTVGKENASRVRPNGTLIAAFVLIFVLAAANGLIKDGIVAWVPNLLYETFFLADYFSILVTLLLPVSAFFGAALVQLLFKRIKSYPWIMAVLYGGSTALLVLVYFFYAGSIVFTVAAFSLLACFMSGVNNILTSALPLSVRGSFRSGRVAGIINTFCYIGSTAATVSLGALASSGGWQAVILLLTILSALAAVPAGALALLRKKND